MDFPSWTTWERVVASAVDAPSVHNTQPWRFELRRRELEVHADPTRQLRHLDPRGRQLRLSCGAAILNARVAIAGAGFAVEVDRRPDATRPTLVARLAVSDGRPDAALARLEPEIRRRHTNRRRFAPAALGVDELAALEAAVRSEGAQLMPIVQPRHRSAVVRLSQFADRYQLGDRAYRAEVRAWTTDSLRRPDGVPAYAVPRVDGTTADEIPLRDFDSSGIGWLPGGVHSSRDDTLLLITTRWDDQPAWARAGEAVQRLLLELTARGYAASPLPQVIEVPHTHQLLRAELAPIGEPQFLLRVGRAPAVSPTPRRPVAEVLTLVGRPVPGKGPMVPRLGTVDPRTTRPARTQ